MTKLSISAFIFVILQLTAVASPRLPSEDGKEMSSTITRLIRAEDFSALEDLRTELWTERSRFSSGEWKLGSVYDAATVYAPSEPIKTSEMLERWQKQFPQSALPLAAKAKVLMQQAWHSRGDATIDKVSSSGNQQFKSFSEEAWTEIEKASVLPNADVHVFTLKLSIAYMNQAPKATKDTILNEAQNLELAYYPLYGVLANFLHPMWGGTPGEIHSVALFATTLTKDKEGLMVYARIAWELAWQEQGLIFSDHGFSWDKVKQGYEEIIKNYPGNRWNLAQYAVMSGYAFDKLNTRSLLDKLGTEWDAPVASAFRKPERLAEFRKWAYTDEDEISELPPLFFCAESGDIPCVEDLIKSGANLNDLSNDATPLIYAAANRKPAMVKFLLSKKADPNIGSFNKMPIYFALAFQGENEMLQDVLAAGVRTDVTVNGWTTLHAASERNLPAVLTTLLKLPDTDVNAKTISEKYTALMIAANNSRLEATSVLLAQPGIQVNLTGGAKNMTALHLAIIRGSKEVVAHLIKHGADPKISSDKGDAYAIAAATGFPASLLNP